MASKKKYSFNHSSLEFEDIRPSIKRTVRRVTTLLVSSFMIAAAYYFLYSFFLDTPTERDKKLENVVIKDQLVELNKEYDKLEAVINDLSRRDSGIYRAIFEANPISMIVDSNSVDYGALENRSNQDILAQTNTKLAQVMEKAKQGDSLVRRLSAIIDTSVAYLKNVPGIQPVLNKSLTAAAASIGMRISPFYKTLQLHTGMDFAVSADSEVFATADGKVSQIWYSQKGSGNRIVIDHGNDYETRYLYLNEILVKKGSTVTRGQLIGKVGNLGMTIPHLHYEVRKDGKIADPLNYFFLELSPTEFERIVDISTNNGQSLD